MLGREIEWNNTILRVCKEQGKIYAQINNGTKHLVTTYIQRFELVKQSTKEVLIKWQNGTTTKLFISGTSIVVF